MEKDEINRKFERLVDRVKPLADWFKGAIQKIREDGLIWALPYSLRVSLLVLAILLLASMAGIETLFLGMSTAFSFWCFKGKTFPKIGLVGEGCFQTSLLYSAALLIILLILMIISYRRARGDYWGKDQRQEKIVRLVSKDGLLVEVLISKLSKVLDFYGEPYFRFHTWVHLAVFLISAIVIAVGF